VTALEREKYHRSFETNSSLAQPVIQMASGKRTRVDGAGVAAETRAPAAAAAAAGLQLGLRSCGSPRVLPFSIECHVFSFVPFGDLASLLDTSHATESLVQSFLAQTRSVTVSSSSSHRLGRVERFRERRVADVTRKWARNLQTVTLRRRLAGPDEVTPLWLCRILRENRHTLTHLNVRIGFSSSCVLAQLAFCSNLRALDLFNDFTWESSLSLDEPLLNIVKSCRKIEKLTLDCGFSGPPKLSQRGAVDVLNAGVLVVVAVT